jgi:hypothetical protein
MLSSRRSPKLNPRITCTPKSESAGRRASAYRHVGSVPAIRRFGARPTVVGPDVLGHRGASRFGK